MTDKWDPEKMNIPDRAEKRLLLAANLAAYAHGDQKYGEENYYTYHVLGVASNFAMDSDEAIVALLHDVIEDTPVTYETVHNLFGATIAEAVDNLTKREGETHKSCQSRFLSSQLSAVVKYADSKFHLEKGEPSGLKRIEYESNLNTIAARYPEIADMFGDGDDEPPF